MSDMDIIKPVIAAAVGRRDASGPINTLPKAQAAIQKALIEACRAVLNKTLTKASSRKARRAVLLRRWRGPALSWWPMIGDDHPDRGEAHELRGLWHASNRLRKENERLREELKLQAVENIERTDQLLDELWAGLKARVMGLERELAELRKLQKFVPTGPAGAINLRKAEVLLKRPFFRTTGLVLANTETGDRTILDMSAVRWMGSESFQDLMNSKWAPVTASPTSAPGTPAAGPRPCNEPGPLRRQMCIVGPQARQTDPGCAGRSQLNAAGTQAVWFEDTEQ